MDTWMDRHSDRLTLRQTVTQTEGHTDGQGGFLRNLLGSPGVENSFWNKKQVNEWTPYANKSKGTTKDMCEIDFFVSLLPYTCNILSIKKCFIKQT